MRLPSLVLRVILLSPLLFGAETALADEALLPGFGSCRDAAYMYVFDQRLGASECEDVGTATITANGQTTTMRVLKLHGSASRDHEALMAEFRELARSVGGAMERMGTVSLGNVSVLLTDTPPLRHAYAHTWTLPAAPGRSRAERECQIAFFKNHGESPEVFYQALAHELFHCMQYRLWERQMGVGDAKLWWSEGTAHYFAYLARPGSTAYDRSLLQFDRTSVRTALHGMSYEAAVFFAWWGQTRGHNAIPAFMDRMPLPGGQTQLEALRNAVSSDEWSEFSRAYLDRSIQLPGGRRIPSTPLQGETLRISEAGVFPLPTKIYIVERRPIIFAPGRTYDVSFEGRPTDARIKWAGLAGTWSDPPATVTACEPEARYREVRGTTSSNTAGVMRVSVPDRTTHCNCLVGEWWMTGPSLVTNLERRAHRSVESHTIVSGGLRLILNPDATPTSLGTGRYVHDRLVYRSEYRPGSGTRLVETTLEDSSPIFWGGASLGTLMITFQHPSRRPEGTVNTSTYMRRPHVPNSRGEDGVNRPVTKTEPLLLANVGLLGPLLGGSAYQCTANSLRIERSHPDGTYYFDFVRGRVPTTTR